MSSVLIVDDRPTNLKIFTRLVESVDCNLEVESFANSRAALACLDVKTFDLIISDFDMPDLTGVELTRRVRASGRHRQTPVLIITAHLDPDVRTRAFAAGASAFMTSPVPHGQAIELCGRLLAGVRAGARRRGAGPVSCAAGPS